ncbi:MAG: 4Fe-4S binding protein [Oscillospiraceae bacterium]|nr:4Fe-4S binding protein [Oscillospiraceae bacterium]
MAFRINEECISCGLCEATCPNECISEVDGVFVIDESKCVGDDCKECVDMCPVGAIVPAE